MVRFNAAINARVELYHVTLKTKSDITQRHRPYRVVGQRGLQISLWHDSPVDGVAVSALLTEGDAHLVVKVVDRLERKELEIKSVTLDWSIAESHPRMCQ